MFAKKDKVTDALDAFWGNNTSIATPQVDSTPEDIVAPTPVKTIGVQENIDRATYGYDPYARASTQETPYAGIDKSQLLKDIFEGRRRGKLNVAVESYQTSPLTGKERKITETIDISPDELGRYGNRITSTRDTDVIEPLQNRPRMDYGFAMQEPARMRQMSPGLFGVDNLINREVNFAQSLKRPTSNPYDIFGLDEFVKTDINKQKQALGGSSMSNDFLMGMNYAPRQMSGIGNNMMSKEKVSPEKQALFRAKLADAAVMRRGLAEEAEYIRSRRLRGEFESGLPVMTGTTDYLLGARRKVVKPKVTRSYTNSKGEVITETTPEREDIERYGGVLGAAKATYAVSKPIAKEVYKTSKPVVIKTAKSTQSFLKNLGRNVVNRVKVDNRRFSKKENGYKETSQKPVDLDKVISAAQEEIRKGL